MSDKSAPAASPVNVADLMVLTAGVAVVLGSGAFPPPWWVPPVAGREPEATIARLFEAIANAGMTVIPVVLFQRFRSGGGLRPAEWLLTACAMIMVYRRLAFEGGVDLALRSYAWPPALDRLRIWSAIGSVAFLADVVALWALGRRVSRRWTFPLLAALPLFAVWGPAGFFANELELRWGRGWLVGGYRSVTKAVFQAVQGFPEHLVVGLPLAATFRELTRGDRRRWSRPEQTGFGIVLLLIATSAGANTYARLRRFPSDPRQLAILLAWAAGWAAAVATGFLLLGPVERLGRRWLRPAPKTDPGADPVS